ncbi:MAG: hypothetical protein FWG80_04965 [Alphaproteobacteria bacterium]|nr:hypothetical protein [Alphaproteobacteria bacterium]
MSLRVAAPLAVTDEAIVSGNGIIILPLLEKIASWSLTTRNDTKCYKRLLRPPDGVARNDIISQFH